MESSEIYFQSLYIYMFVSTATSLLKLFRCCVRDLFLYFSCSVCFFFFFKFVNIQSKTVALNPFLTLRLH